MEADMLYHATYEPLLNSIRANGLGATDRTNWPDSKPEAVYLSTTPDEAYDFAQTCESVPADWVDQIVILAIPARKLTGAKLCNDGANRDKHNTTFEYHGVIDPDNITIYSEPEYKNKTTSPKSKTIQQDG